MIFRNEIKKIRLVFTIFFLIALLNPAILFAKMVTQLVPTLTITEKYTDNYFQTENDKASKLPTSLHGNLSRNYCLWIMYLNKFSCL